MHHYHVLLPEGTNATREGIRGGLDQLDLEPDGYQVGRTMVGTIAICSSPLLRLLNVSLQSVQALNNSYSLNLDYLRETVGFFFSSLS